MDSESQQREGGQAESTAPAQPEEAEAIQKHIAAAEKKREELKPEWLAQYEIQERLSAEPSHGDTSSTADQPTAAHQSSTGDGSSTARTES